MSRRNNRKEPEKIHWNDIKYVINNLPPKDLEIVNNSTVDVDTIDDFLTEQIEVGGHFKFTYDYTYGDCPNASLVFYFDGYPNSGYGLSARGTDFIHCMSILMYKFHSVAKGELFNMSEVTPRQRYG